MPKQYKVRRTFTFRGRRYSVYADTEREAADRMAEKRRELEAGLAVIGRKTTVEAWLPVWFETYVRPTVAASTAKNFGCYFRPITEAVGKLPLDEVRPIHLQQVLNGLAGRSGSYVGKVRQTMKRAFQAAQDNGLCVSNPAARLVMPKTHDGTHRVLTDAERALVLKVAETHPAGLWVLFMLFCGLRPAEASTIEGRDIDREARLLHVRGTKTKSADRFVPVPAVLLEKLPQVGPFRPLFKERGKDARARLWHSFLRAMQIEAGCRVYRNKLVPPFPVAGDLVPYCLRHTYCTDLQAAGVPINVARELMGHADIRTTSAIYTHSSAASLSAAAEAIERFHGGACVRPDVRPEASKH